MQAAVVGLLRHLLIAATQLSLLEGASKDAQRPSFTLLLLLLLPMVVLPQNHRKTIDPNVCLQPFHGDGDGNFENHCKFAMVTSVC